MDLQFTADEKSSHEKLERAKESKTERIKRLTGFDICLCPYCKKGRMFIKRELPRIRSPTGNLTSLLLASCL